MTQIDRAPERSAELDFSRAEYDARVAAVRAEMAARDIDVLLVDQFEHLVYLFGYLPTAARYQACLLPRDGEPHMVVRALDLPTFLVQSWVRSWTSFADDEDPMALVAREAGRFGPLSSLGVETDSHFLTVQRYRQLEAALPDAAIADFAGVMWALRWVKSPAEIDYLRQAAAIADRSLLRAVEAAREGQTERQPAVAAYTAAIEAGADNGRVALFAYGKNSDTLHGRLGTGPLKRGEVMHVETVPQVRGYSARIMRPVVIGEASVEQLHVAERLIAIQDEQIDAMRPGAIAGDVDRILREQVIAEGLRADYPNATAYTLGHHATPRTSDLTRAFLPGETWPLESGMVFHVYVWAKGMAFSETVLVADGGPEVLTSVPRKLFVG
jgi:Xaa-Pro dipeptidase